MGIKFAASLVNSGHEVYALCNITKEEKPGELYQNLANVGCKIICLKRFYVPAALFSFLKALWMMYCISPTVIITMNQSDVAFGGACSLLLRIKYVPSIQNIRWFSGNQIFRFLKEILYSINARNAELLLCCSRVVRQEALGRFGVMRSRTCLVFNSVPERKIYDRSNKERMRTVFANIGRIDPQKGQLRIIKAFLSAFSGDERQQLWLIGDASIGVDGTTDEASIYKERLIDFLMQNDCFGQIQMLGWRNDVPELLRKIDVYVHPSNWEGLSLAVLEAMQAGLPIIISNRMDVPIGFIDKVSGYVVSIEGDKELVSALKSLSRVSRQEILDTSIKNWKIVQKNYVDNVSTKRFSKIVEQFLDV